MLLTTEQIPTLIPNLEAALAGLAMWGMVLGMFLLSNWKLTQAGRSFLGLATAFACLLTMNTTHLFLQSYPGINFVRTLVYGFLVVATIRIGWVVWRGILYKAPPPEGYDIIFHREVVDPIERTIMGTVIETKLSHSGKFLIQKLKRDAFDLSKKVIVGLAAGVSVTGLQVAAASYFDYELSVPVATAIAGFVTLTAQTVAGYIKADTAVIDPKRGQAPVGQLDGTQAD